MRRGDSAGSVPRFFLFSNVSCETRRTVVVVFGSLGWRFSVRSRRDARRADGGSSIGGRGVWVKRASREDGRITPRDEEVVPDDVDVMMMMTKVMVMVICRGVGVDGEAQLTDETCPSA